MSTLESRTIECFARQEYEVPTELLIADDGYERKEGDFFFRILNQKDGDKRIVWSKRSIPEIQAAKKMFNDLIAKGMIPYRVDISTGKKTAEVMRQFDPGAEEVVMSDVVFVPQPMIAGG